MTSLARLAPMALAPPPLSPPPRSGTPLPVNAPVHDPRDAPDWDAAVRTHGRRVVVSLLALGLSLDDAEDTAQRTWTRLIEQQRAGALATIVLPGLAITQARFLALSERRARAKLASDDALELAVDERARGVEQRLVDAQRLARALTELSQCSPAARRVFAAVLGDPPPSHADVARDLGISVQRVRQTLCEVRKRLRAHEEEA